jgi:chromosome segregation ATPase
MSAGRPKRAIVSWGELAERDATDRATQEAMLALPYAYAQLDLHSQAAGHYGRALNAYAGQLDKLGRSIRSIQDGRFLDALLRDETRDDEDWLIRLRALPDTPETYYLMELLASNDFQTGLENYLDLADLQRRLASWSSRFNAYDELVAARENHYRSLLPEIDERFRALDARLQQRLAQYAALVEQRTRMALAPDSQRAARVAELDRNLQGLGDALTLAQAQYDRFLVARQAATDSFAGYDEPLDSLSGKIEEATGKIETLVARQGRLLEKLASDELTARLRRLDVYASKARFGLADSKDRIQRQGQQ